MKMVLKSPLGVVLIPLEEIFQLFKLLLDPCCFIDLFLHVKVHLRVGSTVLQLTEQLKCDFGLQQLPLRVDGSGVAMPLLLRKDLPRSHDLKSILQRADQCCDRAGSGSGSGSGLELDTLFQSLACMVHLGQ